MHCTALYSGLKLRITCRENQHYLLRLFEEAEATSSCEYGSDQDIVYSLFGFQKDISSVSCVLKKNKVVLLTSTLYHDDNIDSTSLGSMNYGLQRN